jgi:Kef-type K+ transport system membrane component KefB
MHHLLSSIEFQMSLLLFVALAGYILASKINQSAVIGEILVGLVIGPSLLGLITYTDFVKSIAHLGAVVLLFVVGLEFRQSKDYREGAEYLHIIFAAIFFVSLGIIADFHAMTKEVMAFLTVLTIVAIITKVVGCALSAYMQRISLKDSMVIGIGMVPRGEVAML